MAKNQALDGRQSFAWILDVEASESSGALNVGDIVIVTAQATSDSAFGTAKLVNKPFFVTKSITPAAGDKCKKCKPIFIGMAKDKSLSKSKETQDVTVDADPATNNITPGIVSLSGSISCSFSVDGEGYASQFIKKRFGDIITFDKSTGAATLVEANTTDKDLVLFAWNARNATSDDLIEFDVVPCLFTSLNHSSSANSPQSFDLDFTGNATDENGYEGATIQIAGGLEFIKKLTTTRAGMDADATN